MPVFGGYYESHMAIGSKWEQYYNIQPHTLCFFYLYKTQIFLFVQTKKHVNGIERKSIVYLLQTNTLSCVYVPQGNERGIELFQTTIGNFPVSAPAPEGFMEISKKNERESEKLHCSK